MGTHIVQRQGESHRIGLLGCNGFQYMSTEDIRYQDLVETYYASKVWDLLGLLTIVTHVVWTGRVTCDDPAARQVSPTVSCSCTHSTLDSRLDPLNFLDSHTCTGLELSKQYSLEVIAISVKASLSRSQLHLHSLESRF